MYFKKRNFQRLADFLFSFDCSLNKNLILSDVLQHYKYFGKSEKFFIELKSNEKLLASVFDLKRTELENFDVFDLFLSDEMIKSKNSELAFFSFYDFLLDDSQTSLKLEFIEIFRLFELFIYESKDKSIFRAEFSFDKSSKFYRFVENFFFVYQKEILEILVSLQNK